MRVNVKALIAGIVFGVSLAVVAWALTTDQIWNKVYSASSQAIRIRSVP